MRFICYVPYNEIELSFIEDTGGEIEEFYLSLKELRQHCGDCEYTEIILDGIELEFNNGLELNFDNISEN